MTVSNLSTASSSLQQTSSLFLFAREAKEKEERGPLVTCYEKAELRLKRSAF